MIKLWEQTILPPLTKKMRQTILSKWYLCVTFLWIILSFSVWLRPLSISINVYNIHKEKDKYFGTQMVKKKKSFEQTYKLLNLASYI